MDQLRHCQATMCSNVWSLLRLSQMLSLSYRQLGQFWSGRTEDLKMSNRMKWAPKSCSESNKTWKLGDWRFWLLHIDCKKYFAKNAILGRATKLTQYLAEFTAGASLLSLDVCSFFQLASWLTAKLPIGGTRSSWSIWSFAEETPSDQARWSRGGGAPGVVGLSGDVFFPKDLGPSRPNQMLGKLTISMVFMLKKNGASKKKMRPRCGRLGNISDFPKVILVLESFWDSPWVKCSDPCVGLDPLVARWMLLYRGVWFSEGNISWLKNRWLKATTLPSSRAWQVPLFAVYLWSFWRQGENPTIEAADWIEASAGLPCYPMTHVNQCKTWVLPSAYVYLPAYPFFFLTMLLYVPLWIPLTSCVSRIDCVWFNEKTGRMIRRAFSTSNLLQLAWKAMLLSTCLYIEHCSLSAMF